EHRSAGERLAVQRDFPRHRDPLAPLGKRVPPATCQEEQSATTDGRDDTCGRGQPRITPMHFLALQRMYDQKQFRLIPKLYLGTPSAKLCFASAARYRMRSHEAEFGDVRSQALSLGRRANLSRTIQHSYRKWGFLILFLRYTRRNAIFRKTFLIF